MNTAELAAVLPLLLELGQAATAWQERGLAPRVIALLARSQELRPPIRAPGAAPRRLILPTAAGRLGREGAGPGLRPAHVARLALLQAVIRRRERGLGPRAVELIARSHGLRPLLRALGAFPSRRLVLLTAASRLGREGANP